MKNLYTVGSLLEPNNYAVRNGSSVKTGLIVEIHEAAWGFRYLVFLSPPGISKWLDEDTIEALFVVRSV